MIKRAILLLLVTIPLSAVCAQDFGFGFDDEDSVGNIATGSGFGVSISGEVSASAVGYLDDFSKGLDYTWLGDIFSGRLNFLAKTSFVEGIINLNLNTSPSPVSLDEAYLRAYFGAFEITAGLRKITWGKADSFGPLDVINPLDYSKVFTEMADNDSMMSVKIARPLVHASFRFGQFSKIEGVFVPNFEPHFIDGEGKWAPAQMGMMENLPPSIMILMPPLITTPTLFDINITEIKPDTKTLAALDYAQAGLRFTTTIGSADIGAQYYYGRLPQPAAKISFTLNMTPSPSADVSVLYLYNPYHQIGIDYAQVLFGFNIRAELAANITGDLKGDDGSVYNPSIAWSVGFDRDVFLGINVNLQLNESIRMMNDKLGSSDMMSVMTGSFDIEGDTPASATRLTAAVSKRFFRDELELRTAMVWGIEDKDFAVMPALIWTRDDLRIAFSGGFFAGNSEGQLGQYRNNNFLKVSLTYMF
ncbi:MAG: hypothetical protein LBQ89_09780 [Treponema sp.]|jgi:hypothetical protein|nr:hypothetical protein [Treponema sp.]